VRSDVTSTHGSEGKGGCDARLDRARSACLRGRPLALFQPLPSPTLCLLQGRVRADGTDVEEAASRDRAVAAARAAAECAAVADADNSDHDARRRLPALLCDVVEAADAARARGHSLRGAGGGIVASMLARADAEDEADADKDSNADGDGFESGNNEGGSPFPSGDGVDDFNVAAVEAAGDDADDADDGNDDDDDDDNADSAPPAPPPPRPPSFAPLGGPALAAARALLSAPCRLDAGGGLFLPAGGWHEGTRGGGETGARAGTNVHSPAPPPIHVALNYWVFPPDGGEDGAAERPYGVASFLPQLYDD